MDLKLKKELSEKACQTSVVPPNPIQFTVLQHDFVLDNCV